MEVIFKRLPVLFDNDVYIQLCLSIASIYAELCQLMTIFSSDFEPAIICSLFFTRASSKIIRSNIYKSRSYSIHYSWLIESHTSYPTPYSIFKPQFRSILRQPHAFYYTLHYTFKPQFMF